MHANTQPLVEKKSLLSNIDTLIREFQGKVQNRLRYGRVSEGLFALRARLHRSQVGRLCEADQSWVEALQVTGGFATHLDQLGLPITAEFGQAAAAILPTLPHRSLHHSALDPLQGRHTALHCFSVDAARLMAQFPALVRFGLEERLLDIVEAYLGVPVALTAVELRKDIGGGRQVGTRLWHLDTEDVRVVRMIVYLSDVTLTDGPFEYICSSLTASVPALRQRAFRSCGDPIFDEEMRAHIPQAYWQPIIGPAGTVLLADNAQCYHHGKVHDAERTVMIYTYTSRQPRYPRLQHNTAFDAVLSARQSACMFVSG